MQRDEHPKTKAWAAMPDADALLDILAMLSGSRLEDRPPAVAIEALPGALWRWGSSRPGDALRFAEELAQGASPDTRPLESMAGGIAYLAACASRGGCPFDISVDCTQEYDDEGGTEDCYSAEASARGGWSFPSAGVQAAAAYAFDSIVHDADWEYRDGSHDGLDFLNENSGSFQIPTWTRLGCDWGKLASLAEAAGLARELRQTLPQGSKGASKSKPL